MHARVVSMEMLQMDTAEAARIYRDVVIPSAKGERGVQGSLAADGSVYG